MKSVAPMFAAGLATVALQITAGTAAPPWNPPPVAAPGLRHRTFSSRTAGVEVGYHIYVPAAYDAEPERRFPVLYWLHGSGGGRTGLAPLVARFDAAIRAGRTPPMLVAFPFGLPNGMWCDSHDGATPVETVVVKELVPHIDATFRTIASREGRIIEGFSMGGYGAARLGFKYPELFGAVSILGGGPLQPDFKETPRVGRRGRDAIFAKVYGGEDAYYRAMSPWHLAETNAAVIRAGTLIRQVIGDLDETLAFNRDFHCHMERLRIPHTFTVLPDVGHNPMALLEALGDAQWAFYRAFLSRPAERPSSPPIGVGFGLGRETGELAHGMTNANDFVDSMARGLGLVEMRRLSEQGVKVAAVFLSLDQMRQTIASLKAHGVRVAYLAYNPEQNRQTPAAELEDLVGSVRAAKERAADYGASLVVGPGMRFMTEREDLYARAAPAADVWLIQSQRFQIDRDTARRTPPEEYRREVARIAELVHEGNPGAKIWVQIVVCPGARPENQFTAAEIAALAQSLHGVADAVRIYTAGAARRTETLKEIIRLLKTDAPGPAPSRSSPSAAPSANPEVGP